jgi:hypothetical protein
MDRRDDSVVVSSTSVNVSNQLRSIHQGEDVGGSVGDTVCEALVEFNQVFLLDFEHILFREEVRA